MSEAIKILEDMLEQKSHNSGVFESMDAILSLGGKQLASVSKLNAKVYELNKAEIEKLKSVLIILRNM